jgi:cytochrome P450
MRRRLAADGLVRLDFGDAYFREPQRTLAPLLAAGERAAFVAPLGSVMLLRHADVYAALMDRRLGAMGVRYYEQQGWSEGPYIDWVRRTMVFLDPPDHDRLRALVNRAFTPRQVARVLPITRQIAERLVGEAGRAGSVDLYDAFAQRLPLQVICELLGVPEVDHAQLGEWTGALSLATAYPTPEARARADDAMRGFESYVGGLVEERRARPRADLLSALVAVEEAGDRLDPDELIAMVVQFLYAGHETTRNLIGNGLFTLLRHPGELARLRADPELVPGAVEEMLRFEPPIIFLTRVLNADLTLGGVELEAGEMVQLSLASANRDPEEFPEPDRFDVGRAPGRHLSFGYGAHFCLGANVARMEARVAFETLLARFGSIELVGPEPPWAAATALRTLERFPVRLVA